MTTLVMYLGITRNISHLTSKSRSHLFRVSHGPHGGAPGQQPSTKHVQPTRPNATRRRQLNIQNQHISQTCQQNPPPPMRAAAPPAKSSTSSTKSQHCWYTPPPSKPNTTANLICPEHPPRPPTTFLLRVSDRERRESRSSSRTFPLELYFHVAVRHSSAQAVPHLTRGSQGSF